ncbi:flocculation protein FLO11-like [Myripristis murdjan]|uniref:flocculation protein FLO11-like n=1 Tax=Myripristis murdjan TaxID=586833 RepID=UPI001175F078|nr:flocculation protein FLO11-like [Myripristis murdjan]
MELPLGGPALRHYTQSRPRPHRQKLNYRPSRPQEPIIESENEVLEHMGRVDEGVEEFFTKRVLPVDTLKKQDEESSTTVQQVAPASSVSFPPPTKTLRRRLGDFFTLKKRRGLKSETSQEGRPKKATIADFIRPLREARGDKDKDKDKTKESDKENEKEKGKEDHSAVTGESAVQETLTSGPAPLRGEAAPPRRALREGKSQSLILLSGSAAAGTANSRNTAKKQYDGQNSFEQKLHLMLQRIGVSKPQPEETQNQEGEMKKAESEGTIIDSKPEPPPTFTKPRTMSTSSDTRHQIRQSASAHESAGKPALLPKPIIKPGPPPATSGRNTPENELAQIQEGESVTPTKPSPTEALPTPISSTLAAAPALTEPTISTSVPDSTNFTISSTSTVTPTDTDICTDSDNPTSAVALPLNVTELDEKASVPAATASTTTVPPASTSPPPCTSTTTPTEITAPAPVTSTISDSITPNLSVTSSSTTITTPSITTSKTDSVPGDESSVSTTSTDLSTKSSLPMLNGDVSTDATPTAISDTTISVSSTVDTVSSISTSMPNMPPDGSVTISSVTLANDDSTSTCVISTSSLTPVSSVTKTTDIVDAPTPTATVSVDATMSSSSVPNIH